MKTVNNVVVLTAEETEILAKAKMVQAALSFFLEGLRLDGYRETFVLDANGVRTPHLMDMGPQMFQVESGKM